MAILITFNIQNRLVNHSTETAVIKVVNDIRLNTDTGKTSVLVLLDLCVAFGTVDDKWRLLSSMAHMLRAIL